MFVLYFLDHLLCAKESNVIFLQGPQLCMKWYMRVIRSDKYEISQFQIGQYK